NQIPRFQSNCVRFLARRQKSISLDVSAGRRTGRNYRLPNPSAGRRNIDQASLYIRIEGAPLSEPRCTELQPKLVIRHPVVQLHEESACEPGRGAPSGNKNAETHGYYRRKIKLEAVSFDDLNFSYSGGEKLPKRMIELLNHCGVEHLVSAGRRRIIERVVFTSVMRAPHTSNFNCYTDMVSSQMRESLALNNGCTLAAYPCRSAAVRGIRARVVSFNNIHRSDHVFRRSRHVLGECRNRRLGRIKTDLVVQLPQHAHGSIAFADDRDQCALASVDDPRP